MGGTGLYSGHLLNTLRSKLVNTGTHPNDKTRFTNVNLTSAVLWFKTNFVNMSAGGDVTMK